MSNIQYHLPLYPRTHEFGFYFFFTYFFSTILLSFVYLFRVIFKQTKKDKGLLFYVACAFFAFIGSTITNLLLTAITSDTSTSWIGPLFGVVYVFGVFYAVVKHQFLGISITISHKISNLVSLLLFIFFYWVGLFCLLHALNIILPKFLVFYSLGMFIFGCATFHAFQMGIQGIANRFFLKGPFPYKTAMEIFTRMLSSSKSVIDLTHIIHNFFVSQIGVSTIYLIVFDHNGETLKSTLVWHYNDERSSAIATELYTCFPNEVFLKLKRNEFCDFSQPCGCPISDLLTPTKVIVPCISNNILTGAIALGAYSTNESYSRLDYDLFQSLASQTAIVLNLILKHDKAAQELLSKVRDDSSC